MSDEGCRPGRTEAETVELYSPLVHHLAKPLKRLARRVGLDREDIIQVGLMGLVEAHRSFDPQRGTKFNTYGGRRARWKMLDEINRYKPGPTRLKTAQTAHRWVTFNPSSPASELAINLSGTIMPEWLQDRILRRVRREAVREGRLAETWFRVRVMGQNVKDLARQYGLSHQRIYHMVKTKDSMMTRILDREIEDAAEALPR